MSKGDYDLEYTVEAEGMPANLNAKMVRNEIVKLLPQRALEVSKVAEESAIEHLEKWANMMETGNYEL